MPQAFCLGKVWGSLGRNSYPAPLRPSRDPAAVLRPVPAVVQGVLPGADHGPKDPVPHRDVHALDPHRPHPGDQGALHDGVRRPPALLSMGLLCRGESICEALFRSRL